MYGGVGRRGDGAREGKALVVPAAQLPAHIDLRARRPRASVVQQARNPRTAEAHLQGPLGKPLGVAGKVGPEEDVGSRRHHQVRNVRARVRFDTQVELRCGGGQVSG